MRAVVTGRMPCPASELEERAMKAFLVGLLIAVVIGGGAAALYGAFGISAAEYFSTPAVRL